MHIQILQENLLRSLLRAGRIAPSKPQLPILQNVLLKAEDGGLRVTATNLETTETIFVRAKIVQEGGICVPIKLFSEYVSSLPQETVELTQKEGSLLVKCASYKATIPGISETEYPPTQAPDKGEPIRLEKEQLIKNLNRVVFSAATDEGRPVLTGIRITEEEGGIKFVATDGYRLSVKTQKIDSALGIDLLIPARAIAEVLKVAGEEKELKNIEISPQQDNQILFRVGDTDIKTRLINGDYPDYGAIIPKKHNTRVQFDRESLQRAVKSASIFARDSANIIKLFIGAQSVMVSANTPQVGEDQIEIDAKIEGEGGEMAFNSRFLLDFLSNEPGEDIVFEMTGSLNPGVFRPANDDSYLHIIMPVRTT